MRGFGFEMDVPSGAVRYWYIGDDGIKRWVMGDKPVDEKSESEAKNGRTPSMA